VYVSLKQSLLLHTSLIRGILVFASETQGARQQLIYIHNICIYLFNISFKFNLVLFLNRGTRCRSCLRHCATSRKVAGSIPDDVTGILYWHNLSSRIMALGLTQPLTEKVPGIFPGGKGGRCVGLTTLPPSCTDCLEIRKSQPPGALRDCPGL
jgi:hypothetical protein